MHTEETLNALNAVGFIGAWHIDYTMHRMRGTGRVGSFFGLSQAKVRAGVDLDLLDRAYLAEDLEAIKRNRRLMAHVGGRHRLRYGLISPATGLRVMVQSIIQVSVDRRGGLLEAKGVLFESDDCRFDPASCEPTHEDALRPLTQATKALDALGYGHLKPVLQVVFKEVARDAILSSLGRRPEA